MRRPTATARVESPLGALLLTADDAHLIGIRVPRTGDAGTTSGDVDHPVIAAAARQLTAWFQGEIQTFDLPLAPAATEEAALLRRAISDIPYGNTMTYGDVAARCGSIARAVGGACKANPFPIVVPCHRVTSAAGPEFYSAGDGPRTKSWLIDFEYSNLPPDQRTRLL